MQLSLPFDEVITDHTLGIFERIKECKSLPILSPLASRILKICQKDETNASQLAELDQSRSRDGGSNSLHCQLLPITEEPGIKSQKLLKPSTCSGLAE